MVFLSGELVTTKRTGMVQILRQVWNDAGGLLLRTRGLSQLLPSAGQVLPVCGVICSRREQCAHKLLLLETRSEKRRSWVLTAPEAILCSWAWNSPGDGGKPSPNSFLNWLTSLAQWKTFCFKAKHSIPCNLGGMKIAAIDWNPWVVPGTLQYNYQLWSSWIEVNLLPFTASDYRCCYEME